MDGFAKHGSHDLIALNRGLIQDLHAGSAIHPLVSSADIDFGSLGLDAGKRPHKRKGPGGPLNDLPASTQEDAGKRLQNNRVGLNSGLKPPSL